MKQAKTKKIDGSSIEGIKKAERLQARGWRAVEINSVTNIITMVKPL
jgi:hypothetical protein